MTHACENITFATRVVINVNMRRIYVQNTAQDIFILIHVTVHCFDVNSPQVHDKNS